MSVRFAPLVALMLLLPGCMGGGDSGPRDSVTLRHTDVVPDDNAQRSLSCGPTTELFVLYSGDGEGAFTVTVRSDNIPIFTRQYHSDGFDTGSTTDLEGPAGTWQLRVDRSLYYNGTFEARLTCG